jgi:hypothetical protein
MNVISILRSALRWMLLPTLACSVMRAQIPPPAPSSPPQERLPTISSAPTAQIVPPPPNYRHPNGQTYVYAVEWHLFNAGTAKVGLDSSANQEHVTATADSGGVVNALYKVHDRFEAFFDSRTFCSLRISKHTEEGSHWRQSEAGFDYAHHKSVLDEKNLKSSESKHVENDLPACVTDVISGFYYLASLPLQSGNSYVFSISDGAKSTQVTAHVEAKEQVKVPSGTYTTVRVRAEATSGPLQGKGTVWAWFSDGDHIPVQMRSKLGWGTLLFRLQRIDK